MSSEFDGVGEFGARLDPFKVETPRLILRAWREADCEPWADICEDPEVMEFLPPGPAPRADSIAAVRRLDDNLARPSVNGHCAGLSAVELKESGELLGFVGVNRHRWFPDELEIGWRLGRSAWGKGYATEAATAWADRAFTVLEAPRLISITMRTNLRSQAVMKRLGLTLDQEFEREGLDIVVYAIGREQWLESRSSAASRVGDSDIR